MKYQDFEKRLLSFASVSKIKLTDINLAKEFNITVNEVRQHTKTMVNEGILYSITNEDYMEYKLPGREHLLPETKPVPYFNRVQDQSFNYLPRMLMKYIMQGVIAAVVVFIFIFAISTQCSAPQPPKEKAVTITYDGYGVTVPTKAIKSAKDYVKDKVFGTSQPAQQ